MFKILFLILVSTVFSCTEWFTENVKVYKEGEKLDATIYSSEQPEKLSDYNQFATMLVGDGIAIIKPDSVPKLIKIIHTSLSGLARIDKKGYIWLTAWFNDFSINNYVYVIDPHSETIYKSIKVPHDLRGPDAIAFGEDKAYFVGMHAGRNIGLGSIDKTNFSVETLVTVDSIGSAIPPGLEFFNDKLYYFGIWSSQTDDRKILQFDTQQNKLVKTALYSGYYTYDKNYFYTNGYFIINGNPYPKLYKLSLDSLIIEKEIPFFGKPLICNDDEFIYSAKGQDPKMDVYRKTDLEKVETIDFSQITRIQGRYFNDCFGFITKEILMLNQASFYNVKTGEILDNIFPLNYFGTESLLLAEGLELKSFE